MAAPERDVITTPVPTVALLAAARAMTEPEPPADLGLERAVRESRFPPAPAADSEPPPSSERRAARLQEEHQQQGKLLPSEAFEFELTSREARGAMPTSSMPAPSMPAPSSPAPWFPAQSHAAPPLAEELGLDHLLADFKPQRSWSGWLRAYGVWIVAALLVLWLIVTFAASWLPG